jgi:hypothetical protein
MAYIGRGIENLVNTQKLDVITPATATGAGPYNLTKSSVAFVPASADQLVISINGVIQYGNFTISGSTVTFDSALTDSDVCDFIYQMGTGLLTVPSDGSVNTAQLADSSVTNAKLAGSIDLTTKVTGTLPYANGGTGLSSLGSAGQALKVNSGATGLEFGDVSVSLSYTKGTFTGDNSTVDFTIDSGRAVDDVLVFVNGFILTPTTDYTISGTTLTFVTAPATSAEIVVRYLPLNNSGIYTNDTATGDNSTVNFTIDSGRTVEDVIVSVNGVTLVPGTDYTISGTTLTFTTAPATSAEISIRYLRLT